VQTREEIATADGELAAEAEAVLVARDGDSGRSRPLTDAERAAFERVSPRTGSGPRPAA
jgi:acyl-CoA thioesterase FadM